MDYGEHRRPLSRRGFTLVELLIVIAIIVILSGMLLLISRTMLTGAEQQRAGVQIQKIEAALADYNAQYGKGWMLVEDLAQPVGARSLVPDLSSEDWWALTGQQRTMAYLRANGAVTRIIMESRAGDDFTVTSGFGKRAEIVQAEGGASGYYLMDPWFDPGDAAHRHAAHMIRIGRNGFNRPELDIWSVGPDGEDQTPSERGGIAPDTLIFSHGDDVVNWGPTR
jgi:prepilin-type N-terminal cleavage/methylation domain-containing protein